MSSTFLRGPASPAMLLRTREYWKIEGKAFSWSYDLAPRLPPSAGPFPPLRSVSTTGDTKEDCERETTCWRERGGDQKPNHTTRKKAWSSINHSIFFACPLHALTVTVCCTRCMAVRWPIQLIGDLLTDKIILSLWFLNQSFDKSGSSSHFTSDY